MEDDATEDKYGVDSDIENNAEIYRKRAKNMRRKYVAKSKALESKDRKTKPTNTQPSDERDPNVKDNLNRIFTMTPTAEYNTIDSNPEEAVMPSTSTMNNRFDMVLEKIEGINNTINSLKYENLKC